MSGPRGRLGVVGTGTMGVGIVQLAALSGFEVVGQDPAPAALETAARRLAEGLAKGAERGRWSAADAAAARDRVRFSADLGALADREAVIEAVPERLDLKRQVLAALAAVVPPAALLATNTSSLSVSALAIDLPRPERLVGMHFFNPPALMRLIEVVPGDRTAEATVARAVELARALGRDPIRATDSVGFVVNRCARPFVGEALRLLGEGVASAATIDRVCREAGGFRMGPLELTDLIGVDVNLEIQESFWRQSFGEPRWRPTLTQARLVQAGRLGRKSGRGFYEYGDGGRPADRDDTAAASPAEPLERVAVAGSGTIADELRQALAAAGTEVVGESAAAAELWVDARAGAEPVADDERPRVVCCAAATLAGRGADGAAGFDLAAPPGGGGLLELARDERTSPASAAAAERLAATLGLRPAWVLDTPGLVLGRLLAQLVNEAAFALQDRVASAADIDLGMRLGMNFPRGPLEWGEERGVGRCLATLDALRAYTGEERYRAAPLLRRRVEGGDSTPLTLR